MSLWLQSLTTLPPLPILGFNLKPFSAWHYIVLDGFNSPYIKGGNLTEQAFIIALWVCSTTFADRDKVNDPNLFVNLLLSLEQIIEQYQETDIAKALQDFDSYLLRYLDIPEFWQDVSSKVGGSGGSGMPAPYKLAASVFSSYPSFTEQEVWDMPFNKLCCYRASVAEDNGANLVSVQDLQKLEKAKAFWTSKEMSNG